MVDRNMQNEAQSVLLHGEITGIREFLYETKALSLEQALEVAQGFSIAISALMVEREYTYRSVEPFWGSNGIKLNIDNSGSFIEFDRYREPIQPIALEDVLIKGGRNEILKRLATMYFELAIM